MAQQWVVVGGKSSGGILVKEGQSTTSTALEARLETGAVVEELELKGERLYYKLFKGSGPPRGWVSLKLQGKPLLEQQEAIPPPPGAPFLDGPWEPIPANVWENFPKLEQGAELRPKTPKEFKERVNDADPGEYWGIRFPFTPTMLREMGPEWVTLAMHTAGSLPPDDTVTKFLDMSVHAEDVTQQDAENAKWGGAGIKILLDVECKSGAKIGLFIKMPHEYKATNERQKNSFGNGGMMDWSEVTFYNVCGGRFGRLPFKSPKMYFCDMCRRTTNFINIVEKIPYARTGTMTVNPGEYYPAPEKYKDWALPNNGVELYYAHTKAMAQFFAWHRKVRETSDQLERVFMPSEQLKAILGVHEAVAASGPYNSPLRDSALGKFLSTDPVTMQMAAGAGFPAHTAKGFLDMAVDFIQNSCPQAFPPELLESKYFDKFKTEAEDMSKYCGDMNWYMSAIPEYFALCHPNAQVDNAFYWKSDAGEVQCGLLDWGGISHANIPTCLGNGWMGAEPEVMEEHEEKLIQLFVDEYEKVTGFRFDCEHLHMCMKLAQCAVFYGCCANIGMCLRIFKRDVWRTITGRKDPKIDENFLLRCYWVQVYLWLKMWGLKNSPYKYFQKFRKQLYLPKKN